MNFLHFKFEKISCESIQHVVEEVKGRCSEFRNYPVFALCAKFNGFFGGSSIFCLAYMSKSRHCLEVLLYSAAIICLVQLSHGAGGRVLFAHLVLGGDSITGRADVLGEPFLGVSQVDDLVR